MKETKLCTKCKSVKPLSAFYIRKDRPCGYYSHCRACQCAATTKWLRKHPEKNRERARIYAQEHPEKHKQWAEKNKGRCKILNRKTNLAQYGITLAEYDELFEKQNGNCAVCGLPEITRRLSVDHNHETNEIRGLLCSKCNFFIGLAQENPDILNKAIDYLVSNSIITPRK